MIIKTNKCLVVILKFTILQFLEIFGCDHHGNRGPTVYIARCVCACKSPENNKRHAIQNSE